MKTRSSDAADGNSDTKLQDFKEEVAEITGLIPHWEAGEIWSEIVQGINGIASQLTAESPLLSKLNALKGIASLIESV